MCIPSTLQNPSEKFSTNFNSTTGKMIITPVNSETTTEELQDFLRGFTFSSNSKNPVTDKAFRTIELSITDQGGGTENTSPETTTQLITFNVIESNDPPTIAVSDAVVSEPVGASSIISLDLGPKISISDADDEFLSFVTINDAPVINKRKKKKRFKGKKKRAPNNSNPSSKDMSRKKGNNFNKKEADIDDDSRFNSEEYHKKQHKF